MKKKIIIIAIVAAAAVLCGYVYYSISHSEQDEPEPAAVTAESDSSSEDTADPHAGQAQSLLTGEWIDAQEATYRPAAVMVEDTKTARPSYGLNSAGVVYECPMEGGMSRLMAIFDHASYTQLDKIGNVRSCRPYFAYIAREYDAIYVHFGQSVQGEALLESGIVDHLSGLDGSLGRTFYRTSDRKAPHNAYTSGSGITEGILQKGFRQSYEEGYTGHFTFAAEDSTYVPADSTSCTEVDLYYSNTKPYFIYDDSTGLYARYEFGEPSSDGNDGAQITAANIILQNVPSSIYANSSTPYLNIPLNGSGTGKYLTSGRMIDITWQKDSDTSVTHYYSADGTEITLNRGRTWICLIENASSDKNVFKGAEESTQ